MHTSALGPFTVSRLTLGTGRLASSGSGRSISAVARLLDTATDLGINLIDTADSYASGECERLLGRALVGRRDKFIICSKAGYTFCPYPWLGATGASIIKQLIHRTRGRQDFGAARIRRSLEASLLRLRVTTLDLFLLHTPSVTDLENPALLEVLQEAQQAGRIRAWGVSCQDPVVVQMATKIAGCQVFQLPVNPFEPSLPPEVLASLAQNKKGIMANRVFLSGDLLRLGGTGLSQQHLLDQLSRRANCTLSALLLQFADTQPGVSTVLTGTTQPTHLQQNASSLHLPLPPAVLSEMRSIFI